MEGFLEILRQIVDPQDIRRVTGFDESKTNQELLEDYVKNTYKVSSISDSISFENGKTVNSANGCEFNEECERLNEAIQVAKQADMIVMTLGGLNEFGKNATSGEGKARCDLDLPKGQIKLIDEIAKLNKKMILVLINGRPLTITKIEEHFDAIIEVFINGPYGGQVIAEAIFGKFNPSRYTDIENRPLYPFGFGLSYAKFEVAPQKEIVVFKVGLKNVSERAGQEVIQSISTSRNERYTSCKGTGGV